MPTILIIDDERAIRSVLADILKHEGIETDEAENGEDGIAKFERKSYDAVLCDIKMPKLDGLGFLEKAKQLNTDVPIIMVSGSGTIATAVEAVKKGAYDYLTKPPELNRLLITIRNALDKTVLVTETKALKRKVNQVQEIIGESAAIKKIKDTIDKVAQTDARVLITGANGSGKELVARWMHEKSNRSNAPLIEVNCAAIPSELIESELFGHEKGSFTSAIKQRIGKFEQANGGTLFLDEIGDMSLSAQAKVLRALQEGKITRVGGDKEISVNVRVIAATNKDLKKESDAQRFRSDLYFRLNVFQINLLPLRERIKDIEPLAKYFIQLFAEKINKKPLKTDKDFLEKLEAYQWPGNIRELRNAIEYAADMCEEEIVNVIHLPDWLQSDKRQTSGKLAEALHVYEKQIFISSLEKHGHSVVGKTKIAKELGISLATLYKKLKALGIYCGNF